MNKRIIDYCIVNATTESVVAKLHEGWQPFGSVFTSGYSTCQAMVKYEGDGDLPPEKW